MNAILLDHQTHAWQLIYNPALPLSWIEDFLNGQQEQLNFEDFRLHASPGDEFIDSERGPGVVHLLQHRLWPWQATKSVLSHYSEAIASLQRQQIVFAMPWVIGLKLEETRLKHDFLVLRKFIPGTPLLDYYLQHGSLTPGLASLAAEVCSLLKKLAEQGFRVKNLRAHDIVYADKQLVLVNWWRMLPQRADKVLSSGHSYEQFMLGWQKRVDCHNLFVESFRRIGIKV